MHTGWDIEIEEEKEQNATLESDNNNATVGMNNNSKERPTKPTTSKWCRWGVSNTICIRTTYNSCSPQQMLVGRYAAKGNDACLHYERKCYSAWWVECVFALGFLFVLKESERWVSVSDPEGWGRKKNSILFGVVDGDTEKLNS